MEIFIDLAKLTEGQPEPILPGIDLNLSGLVDFKSPEEQFSVKQSPLKTEFELSTPSFNPTDFFAQIQSEFAKIELAQKSESINDDLAALKEAQQNSSVALDPLAAYLENRFEKITQITTDENLIRELIQGVSDTRLTEVETILTNPLNQMAALEKESSVNSVVSSVEDLVKNLSTGATGSTNQAPGNTEILTTQLTTNQETFVNQTTQSIANLADLVSNFTSNLVNNETFSESAVTSLAEPTREALTVTRELPKPDFSAESLLTLKQIAESGQVVSASPAMMTTNSSQVNTTSITELPGQPPVAGTQVMPSQGGMLMMPGGGSDGSSAVLYQMLNFLKSGQLKVKLS